MKFLKAHIKKCRHHILKIHFKNVFGCFQQIGGDNFGNNATVQLICLGHCLSFSPSLVQSLWELWPKVDSCLQSNYSESTVLIFIGAFLYFWAKASIEGILQQKWTMVTKLFVTICPYFITEYIWWRNSIRHLSSVIECIGDENVSSPIKKW